MGKFRDEISPALKSTASIIPSLTRGSAGATAGKRRLRGFRQERDIRHFTFKGANDDRTHSEFTVAADVSLLRKYGIAVQELPLLCLHLLEQQTPISSAEVVQ